MALAVSGHGFGHAVRSAEVARALLARGARVLVRTDAPAWLFPDGVVHLPTQAWPLDIGVAQHDGLELDIDATRARWARFAPDFQRHAQHEADQLTSHSADVLLGDIPPLAFAAAARAGLPSLALANFGWDWIYACWPDFRHAIQHVQDGYKKADVLLRLPLHSPRKNAFPAFAHIEDVPMIGRHAAQPRSAVRGQLGIPENATVVLLSFGGFTARGFDLAALARWPAYRFLVTPPLSSSVHEAPENVVALPEVPVDYVSLINACDVVVTKPGYGIVADCLANQVAVLFTDRGPFREYDILADALPRLGRARFIPRDDLLAGRLGPHLDALLALETPWSPLRMDGAAVVAERVLAHATLAGPQKL